MGADATAYYIQDSADTDSALSISTTRVGIGTASPDRQLEISHGAAAHTPVLRLTGTDVNAYAAEMEWYSGAGGGKITSQMGSTASSSQGGVWWLEVRDQTSNDLVRRMHIDKDGKCGIGTASPDRALDVTFGTAQHDGVIFQSTHGSFYFSQNGGSTSEFDGRLRVDNSGTGRHFQLASNIDSDSGTYPAINFVGRYNDGAVSTRPIFKFSNHSTTLMTIDSSGNVEINNGNLKIGTAGKGINFDAYATSGNPSSNLLDDYEEGTWTGVISDGTNNATMSGSYTTGSYTKIGDVVTIAGRFTVTSLGSASGAMRLIGLPFTPASNSRNDSSISIGWAEGLAITASGNMGGVVQANTAYVELTVWDATTGTSSMSEAEISADGAIRIGGTYIVA